MGLPPGHRGLLRFARLPPDDPHNGGDDEDPGIDDGVEGQETEGTEVSMARVSVAAGEVYVHSKLGDRNKRNTCYHEN